MAHYTTSPDFFPNLFHSFFGFLDWCIYTFIVQIYKLFFAVSTSTIIDGSVVKEFYKRIQLIIGIFMIFKLAVSLLNLIINPDLIKDKNSGTGKIVARIILCLLMLTTIVPLNIPGAQPRTLNGYINDQGILFGTLYAIQDRILSDQVIAKLLLGYQGTTVEDDDSSDIPDTSLGNSFEGMGQLLSSTILKSFILINVKDDTVDDICNGDASCSNVYCVNEVQNSGYLDEEATVGTITDVVNLKCNSNGEKYAFYYMPVISTIVGVVVAILLLGYTIDVAIRAMKLVVLRIIAPIPILSYIDPKASKDGAFASWTKTLISTYLDLFIRLSIIYFGIFVIASLIQSGISGVQIGNGATGILKAMTLVFLIVGLLFFMKQAPNFIKSMLGTKGVGFGPGISGALGFMGGFMAGGGIRGSLAAATTAANATNEAQAQGKVGPGALSAGRDLVTQIRTGDDKRKTGFLNNAQRYLTDSAKHGAADRIGAGADNVQFRKDKMLHDQGEYQEAETVFDLAKSGVHQTATATYVDTNGRTVNVGDYVDSRGNVITYRDSPTSPVQNVDNIKHLAQARDQRRDAYESSQRSYEKIDKANKALDTQETEYEKVMNVRRHNRHIARRNDVRHRSGGPGTYSENRETVARNRHNSGGGEAL